MQLARRTLSGLELLPIGRLASRVSGMRKRSRSMYGMISENMAFLYVSRCVVGKGVLLEVEER